MLSAFVRFFSATERKEYSAGAVKLSFSFMEFCKVDSLLSEEKQPEDKLSGFPLIWTTVWNTRYWQRYDFQLAVQMDDDTAFVKARFLGILRHRPSIGRTPFHE